MRSTGARWQASSSLPRARSLVVRAKKEEEADWEEEMSIFKQRMMRPNQLATLRELESKVSVGKVGFDLVVMGMHGERCRHRGPRHGS